MATTATLHLSKDFVASVAPASPASGAGSWVYLYANKPPAGGNWITSPTQTDGSAFATLVNNGALVTTGSGPVLTPDPANPGGYVVSVDLTTAATPTVSGGHLFLVVQSEPVAGHTDLTKNITQEGLLLTHSGSGTFNINGAWNYGYTGFEYALQGKQGDQGDITYIPAFGPHVAVQINYTDGTSDSRGLKYSSADTITKALATLTKYLPNPPDTPSKAVINYPTGGILTGPELLVGPSNNVYGSTLASGFSSTFGVYSNSDWDKYLEQIGGLSGLRVSLNVGGVADASRIYHNGSYGSYGVNVVHLTANEPSTANPNGWGKEGRYWLFSPTTGSQTKGYMLISEDALKANLYAPGQGGALAQLWGTADITKANAGLAQPFILPGSSSPPGSAPTSNYFNVSGNNEFGNLFTKLFVGISAGNFGAIDNQANAANRGGGATGTATNLATTVNLNNSTNWEPQYQFDGQFLEGTPSLRINSIPNYQHFDPYAFSYYQISNAYSSAFTDGIFSGIKPGPQINLSTAGTVKNVANIDLYAYGANEVDGKFVTPAATNFIVPASGNSYLTPTSAAGSNLILQIAPYNNAVGLRSDAKVQLGIFNGLDLSGNATFKYVTLPTSGNLAQNITINGSPSSGWTAQAAGTNGGGFLQINNLPLPVSANKGDIYWFQVVVSDSSGGNQKVFDLYATADAKVGQLQAYNPATAQNNAPVLAATDGNALLNTAGGVGSQFTFTLAPDQSLNSELIQIRANPAAPLQGIIAAPVAGNIAYNAQLTQTFAAINGQDGTGVLTTQGYTPIVNPGATSTASTISGNTLTIGGTIGGYKFSVGDTLSGAGIPTGTVITNLVSGTGGVGTYTINNSANISTPVPISGTQVWTNPTPSITIDKGLPVLGFGWTGTNNGIHANAPTQPLFLNPTSTNPTYIVDGQVSQYTNKISAGDQALVSFFQADGVTPVGFGGFKLTGVGDLDGQWTTNGVVNLGNGTFQAKVQEMLPDGTAPLAGAPISAPLNITVNMSKLPIAPTSAADGIKFGSGDAAGNWLRFDPSSTASKLASGATVALYATDASGKMLDRITGQITTSLDNATLAKIGDLQADAGHDIYKAGQSVFLQSTQQLKFAVYNNDGTTNLSPLVTVSAPAADGSLKVNVAGLDLSAAANNSLMDQAYLSSSQHSTNLPLTYFNQGQTVNISLVGSGADVGVLTFTRVDVNPTTGAISVGGVAYGTPGFNNAALNASDPGFSTLFGGGGTPSLVKSAVTTGSGYYAPLTVSWDPNNFGIFNVFTIGTTNNADGREHVRIFGENTFGVEDRLSGQGSDFDYNDLIIGINAKLVPA